MLHSTEEFVQASEEAVAHIADLAFFDGKDHVMFATGHAGDPDSLTLRAPANCFDDLDLE